jgi:hypothetical protein
MALEDHDEADEERDARRVTNSNLSPTNSVGGRTLRRPRIAGHLVGLSARIMPGRPGHG